MSELARRGAFSLIETVLASALLALIAIAMLTASSSGVQTAARAGEMEVATLLAGKCIDRLKLRGFPALQASVGATVALDLATLGEPGDGEAAAGPGALLADGIRYRATATVEEVHPGLLRLGVALRWERQGALATREPSETDFFCYLADPVLAMKGMP